MLKQKPKPKPKPYSSYPPMPPFPNREDGDLDLSNEPDAQAFRFERADRLEAAGWELPNIGDLGDMHPQSGRKQAFEAASTREMISLAKRVA